MHLQKETILIKVSYVPMSGLNTGIIKLREMLKSIFSIPAVLFLLRVTI